MIGYQEKILRAGQRGAFNKVGLYPTFVLHDDWCPQLKGTGPCACNAEVIVEMSDGSRRRVNDEGELERFVVEQN